MQMQSDQVDQLFTALSKAQGQMKPAIKDSKNPFFKSKYADLNSVFEACREPFAQNGLCISQTMQIHEGQNYLITTLGHSSGQWIKSLAPIISAKPDAQSFGSAVSYQKRYALSAIAGICTGEDDDGNAAMPKNDEPKKDEPKKNILTTVQIEELKGLWMDSTKEIQDNVMKILKLANVKKFDDAPAECYSSLKDIMLKNLKENLTQGLENG